MEAEITIYVEGKEPIIVVRPIHHDGSRKYITYKRQQWTVNAKNEVYIDDRGENLQAPNTWSTDATATSRPEETRVSAPFAWDPEQEAVVTAPAHARLLVDAGPGTGKTAVACGRVAHLIRTGVPAAKIFLISFTRTAVTEIRERIAALAADVDQAYAVTISTLDSHAWMLLNGLDDAHGERFFRSFSENIQSAIELLRGNNDDLAEYLGETRHLIVDEAQDFVSERADLVEAIIGHLGPDCGVTVFSDDAQAIYCFSTDDQRNEGPSNRTLPERLRSKVLSGEFQQRRLRKVYRTSATSLLKVYTRVRDLVLPENGTSDLEEVRREIKYSADAITTATQSGGVQGDNVLVLYRRRADVLQDASFRNSRGEEHRIRMSALPRPVFPWVAALLWDWTSAHLRRDDFEALCAQRLHDLPPAARPETEGAWKALFSVAGDRKTRRVDTRKLRNRLASEQPPLGLFSSDIGWSGPVVGTIHGSKGREATEVHLMLPHRQDAEADDADEECRVMFVGATRAKERLKVGTAARCYARYVNRRVYATQFRGWPRVEIGREGDVDIGLQVARSVYETADSAVDTQRRLAMLINKRVTGYASANRKAAHRYELRLTEADTYPLAVLSPQVEGDLIAMARKVGNKRKPPLELRHIHIVGVRTVALSADDPRCEKLHAPFSKSGIFLSPVIHAFTMAVFRH